jgi:hypothetical protein
MDKMDRKRVIRKLTEVADSTCEASRSSEDMQAYTHRLVKHLLGSVSPEWQLTTTEPSAAPVGEGREGDAGSTGSGPTPAVAIPPPQTWNMPSAQQMIQENLWHPSIFQDVPTLRTPAQHHQCSTGNSAYHPPAPDVIPGPITNDVLFPAADDDIWCVHTGVSLTAGSSSSRYNVSVVFLSLRYLCLRAREPGPSPPTRFAHRHRSLLLCRARVVAALGSIQPRFGARLRSPLRPQASAAQLLGARLACVS